MATVRKENKLLARSFSRQSSMAINPSNEGPHRLDLLIDEQKTVVKNSQDGLQQSLAILERATSKEEKESARLQVQSLLSRAEGLVIILKVICEIRTELGHIQRELITAKKSHSNPRSLYVRQQWLESRLEKLLLAKKRGRPGGRGGQRNQQLSVVRDIPMGHSKRKSIGTVSTFSSPSKYNPGSCDSSLSDRDTNLSLYDSTLPTTSVSTRGRLPPAMPSPSGSEMPGKSGQGYEGLERSIVTEEGSPTGGRRSHLFQSSRSGGSDVWHSESEANWTLVEGSFRNYKDVAQSQVLSDSIVNGEEGGALINRRASVTFDDPPVSPHKHLQLKETLSPFLEQDESKLNPPIEAATPSNEDVGGMVSQEFSPYGLGFDVPRSTEIYGSCSWNILPLAVHSNLVGPERDSYDNIGSVKSEALLRAGLGDFCHEVDLLKKLIQDAALATSVSGRLLSTGKRAALRARRAARSMSVPSRVSIATTSTPGVPQRLRAMSSSTESSTSSLPSINNSNVPPGDYTAKKSRKLFNTKTSTYPQSSDTWYCSKGFDSIEEDTSSEDLLFVDTSVNLQASLRMRYLKSRQRSRRSGKSRATTAVAQDDIFDRKFHQSKHIEYLLRQTESLRVAERRDSVKALGSLPQVGSEAMDKLVTMLRKDEDHMVKYHSLCSLLQLGVVKDEVIEHIHFFLSEGSANLQSDLLQLMCKDCILAILSEKVVEGEECVLDRLRGILNELLASDDETVSFFSAVLLSHAHINRSTCTEKLRATLTSSPVQSHRTKALKCLLECWNCIEDDVLRAAILQMAQLRDWKLRLEVVETLLRIGGDTLMKYREAKGVESKGVWFKGEESKGVESSWGIMEILARRLTQEPMLKVRRGIGRLLRSLNLDSKVERSFLSDLESHSEVTRTNAVLALSAFELRERKTVHLLQECMLLDPSIYVRVQVARAFGNMIYHDPLVIDFLKKNSAGQDIVARECASALQNLCNHLDRR